MKVLIRVRTITEFETVVETDSLEHAISDAKLDGLLTMGKVIDQRAEVEILNDPKPIPTCCIKHQELGYDDGGFCFGEPEALVEEDAELRQADRIN